MHTQMLEQKGSYWSKWLMLQEGMVVKLQESVETEEERFKGRILGLEQEKEQLSTRCKELQETISAQEADGSSRSQENAAAIERLQAEKEQLSSKCKEFEERVNDLEAAGSCRSQENAEAMERLHVEKEQLSTAMQRAPGKG